MLFGYIVIQWDKTRNTVVDTDNHVHNARKQHRTAKPPTIK